MLKLIFLLNSDCLYVCVPVDDMSYCPLVRVVYSIVFE